MKLLTKQKAKTWLWKLSPKLYGRLTKPFAGQVFSIGLSSPPSPFELQNTLGSLPPLLTANDIHDVPAAFVADPFIVHINDQWCIFFEVLNRINHRGEIGLATSRDGQHWQYQHIVLAEPYHLAYPQVFSDGDDHYMIPDTPGQGVNLYRAMRFPDQWQFEQKLLGDTRITDPTIFRHADRWWMFSGNVYEQGKARSTRLHFSDHVSGPWVEHPASPIVADDLRHSRPAGPVIQTQGRLFRLSQDCSRIYGERVEAHEIVELTTTNYREQISDSTLLQGGAAPWNAGGMHHISLVHSADGEWIAAVDGWYMQSRKRPVHYASHPRRKAARAAPRRPYKFG